MILERYAYTHTETMGLMTAGDNVYYTIERPWIPGAYLGGKNFESCIPDADYQMESYRRQNGDWSLRLVNEDAGVYRNRDDRRDGRGRWACLIHVGNYASDVVGCIAPGMGRSTYRNRPMVTNSRQAMAQILKHVRQSGDSTLQVGPALGTTPLAVF